jgi:hypothetical protein
MTDVLFRKWNASNGGGIIALFPEPDELCDFGRCWTYMEEEGLRQANPEAVMAATKPAQPEEYAAIQKVLQSPPWNWELTVLQRRRH